jgi:shikimate 5-dehydrogenase
MKSPDRSSVTQSSPPMSKLVVKTLTDKELRKHAMALATDAIVFARTAQRTYEQAEKKGKGKRKAIVVVGAGGATIALVLAAKSILRRNSSSSS